ncbi:Acetate kinase [bioreactor metagenome]|jgi:acetate kinase (EC 2.7.2.1)
MAEMGSVDAIVFTAGLGENSSSARLAICGGMEGIGIEIDAKENDMRGEEKVVSKPSSKISVLVVPTNEELMIARDTLEIVKSI